MKALFQGGYVSNHGQGAALKPTLSLMTAINSGRKYKQMATRIQWKEKSRQILESNQRFKEWNNAERISHFKAFNLTALSILF